MYSRLGQPVRGIEALNSSQMKVCMAIDIRWSVVVHRHNEWQCIKEGGHSTLMRSAGGRVNTINESQFTQTVVCIITYSVCVHATIVSLVCQKLNISNKLTLTSG